MRKICFFGRSLDVRFDTDPVPEKSRVKRGMTCTLLDSDTQSEVSVARAECSRKDTFNRKAGEGLSLHRALMKIVDVEIDSAKKIVMSNPKPVSTVKAVVPVVVDTVPAIIPSATVKVAPKKTPAKKSPVKSLKK